MMLGKQGIANKDFWEEAGIALPEFDIEQVTRQTKETPEWVHFGAGNIFRGFIAHAHQKVLDADLSKTGIIAVDTFDFEVIDKVYKPFDNLTLLVLMQANGEFQKKVIASIVESLAADKNRKEDIQRLEEIFESPSLQMASFTITEKGYALKDANGNYFDVVKADMENGPESAMHAMSTVTALAYKRYQSGAYPLTFVSMDNCSHNGDKLKNAVLEIGKAWEEKNLVEKGFAAYLQDEQKITFPLSMIDKITPRPSDKVQGVLEALGIENIKPIVTSKNSYMAPFVNSEISEYLVVEDKFTNGRPALETAGVIFTDRETVNRVETMKVTTCLNPLHTALAVSGCVLGYSTIAEEMQDETLKKWIEKIGYDEGLKVVVDPGILDPKVFIDEVIGERFVNPFIPDTPQRIATDTSQKVGIRYGETIKSYMKDESLDASKLTAIPLAIAAWIRYLLGVRDDGETFELSPDPLMADLKKNLEGIALGQESADISKIVANETIFGLNLYEAGLGEKIEGMFLEMIAGPGAFRKTLEKYV